MAFNKISLILEGNDVILKVMQDFIIYDSK